MVDGVALLTSLIHGLRASGMWGAEPRRQPARLRARPSTSVYTAADGGHVAVGALEPQFYALLLELLEIPAEEMPQHDTARWPEFKQRLAAIFAARPTAEWAALLEPEDACAHGRARSLRRP